VSIENKIRLNDLQESPLSYIALRLLGNPDAVWSSKLKSNSNAKNLLIVAPDTRTADTLISDLNCFNKYLIQSTESQKIKICPFLPWEVLPFDGLSPAQELSCVRINTLYSTLSETPCIIVATIDSLMQRFVAPEILLQNSISLTTGQNLNRDFLIDQLDILGYQRNSVVEEHGQVAIRGAVVDIYPPGFEKPVRLELFGDQLESIRLFNPETNARLKT
jgi:transcription-repair coupling factor (superfamily II helicase)